MSVFSRQGGKGEGKERRWGKGGGGGVGPSCREENKGKEEGARKKEEGRRGVGRGRAKTDQTRWVCVDLDQQSLSFLAEMK